MLLCIHTYINHNHKAHYLNIKALYFAHHCFLTTWFKNISYSNRLSLPRKIFNFIFKHTLCCWIIHSLVHMNGKRHTHYLNKIYSRENTQQGSLGSRGKKKVSRKKIIFFLNFIIHFQDRQFMNYEKGLCWRGLSGSDSSCNVLCLYGNIGAIILAYPSQFIFRCQLMVKV